ncbi:peptidoglycan binding domain-containing protein [Kitasatospora sp. GAS1066B]|uniref:peptidoglycan binding domain-containing protein n=1 Tax=Kitasatospora sp. GAS1066B TaxID=3156271 RepID=UPI003517A1FE
MSSRESDSAYPSSRRGATPGHRTGEGADAYPSGTPPYGIPGLGNGFDPFAADPAARVQQPGAPGAGSTGAGDDEVPKTETTLTTRISINIPGSRPIPPVVVRSTVKPEEQGGEPPAVGGPRHRAAPPASPVLGVMEAGGHSATPPDLPAEWRTPQGAPESSEAESTGEWFRPRQKSRPESVGSAVPRTGVPSSGPTAAAPPAAQGAPAGSVYQQSAPPAAPVFSAESTLQTPLPHPTAAPASPFAPPGQAGYPADPYAGGDPYAGHYQGGYQGGGAYPGSAPYANAGPYAGDPYQGAPEAPYTPDHAQPLPAADHGATADPFGTTANPRPTGTPGAPGRFAKPQPPVNPPGSFGRGPHGEEPEDTQIGGFDPISGELPAEAIPGLPVAGRYGTAPGDAWGGTAGAPNAAYPAGPPPAPGTLNPSAAEPAGAPFGAPAPTAAPESEPAPAAPKPPAPAAAKPKPRPKAQKLLATGLGGVLFLGAAAYGTGLMLNQADVPRGTTVLGTGIGGDSRDQAVHQLDGTVGKIGAQPIQLKIGDQTLPLDPTTAGLSFDTTATVDGLTKHSYNPQTVIGSLAGGSKAVPPVVNIDRAKLKSALDSLAASTAQGLKEGYVQFSDSGDPTVVPGQAGQAVNGDAAVNQVVQSYQDRANGKTDAPITLAVTAAQPKVSTTALQQAADGLGKAIISGNVTVQSPTGSRRFVFTKAIAAKALTLAPDASGNIGPKWDLDQLGAAVGSTFDKVKFRKSDGTLATITTQDVADGIASVYDKNSVAERTFKFHM